MSEFVTVAKLPDIPPGHIKHVDVQGKPVVLCNVDGQVFAVGNLCTHDNGPLSGGSLEGFAIECPRHGAQFDVRNGKVLRFPAARPIPAYEVHVEGDEVKVRVSPK